MVYATCVWMLVTMVGGCATDRAVGTADANQPVASVTPVRQPRTAAALVFEPALVHGVPLASLSRQGRAPEAFVGYEQQQTEYYTVVQRDQQVDQDRNGLDRRAYTTRSSITGR